MATLFVLFTLLMVFVFLACQVIVTIHLFMDFGPISAVFSICCVPYAFIWGWKEWKDSPFKLPVMIAWSGSVVVYAIGRTIFGFFL